MGQAGWGGSEVQVGRAGRGRGTPSAAFPAMRFPVFAIVSFYFPATA